MDYKFDKTNHIHKLGGKKLYGTTSVIKEVLPAPLSYYGSGRACKFMGWYDRKPRVNYLPDEEGMPILEGVFEKIKQMKPEEYLSLLDKAYEAHITYRDERAKEGTATHENIEKVVKEAIKNNKGYLRDKYDDKEVEAFAEWGRGKKFLGSEVHVYSEKLFIGGIIDLVFMDNKDVYLGDVKTSKGFYPNQIIQAGLYDYQQAENGFFTPEGKLVGKPKKIKGYTIIRVNKKVETKTYFAVDEAREFAINLVALFKRLKKLKEFVKK